jgi:enoyl-CoA hydratase/carnithine racemase
MAEMSRAAKAADAQPILLREDREGIAILTLNRPQARNALSAAMIAALSEALSDIRGDCSIRAAVLAGNGLAFCAGHDLKEMTARRADADRGRAFFQNTFDACAAMMQAVVHLPQPVIAAVEGPAHAAGCQLAASCDLVVASDRASFATPGVNIGLFCSAPMVALSRKIASNHAMEMLLTGEPVSAARAREIGLVNQVVPHGKAVESALSTALTIAAKSSHVQKIGKEAFYKQIDMKLADAYAYTSKVMAENMMARDAEEGISAFVEKRTPKWEDR